MMRIDVINLNNDKVQEVMLSTQVFGVSMHEAVIKRCVIYQLAKAQKGTHKTKVLNEVQGTGKKPFKQKGTGNARLGSRRAPQCRGGAVIFGPVVRSHAISIPKKIWKLGIRSVLSSKLLDNKLIVLDNFCIDTISTKQLASKLNNFKWHSVLFVDIDFNDNFLLSLRNIPHTLALKERGVNVYDLLKYEYAVISVEAIQSLEQRLCK